MKKFISLLIITSVWLTPLGKMRTARAAEPNAPKRSTSAQNNFEHRYVLFLQGITSKSSQSGPPLSGDFQNIEDHLRDQGFYQFVYFSYAAATSYQRGELMCRGWGDASCTSDPNADLGDLASLFLSPEYEDADTKISVDRQADALDWLIGQIIKQDPLAIIDIIGFSLGGIIATHWGSRTAGSIYYPNMQALVIMGSPVGGIPLAGPFMEGCDTLDLVCKGWLAAIMRLYGNEVAAQLQLPTNDPNVSIIDELPGILQNPHFTFTSIQSTDDYTVNDETMPLCRNLVCTAHDDVPIGRGSQYWPSHPSHYNYSLGGLGLAEDPIKHTELFDYLSVNHSATLKHQLTAEWAVEALLPSGSAAQPRLAEYDAVASGFAYDLITTGEDATLEFSVQNIGLNAWEGSDILFMPMNSTALLDAHGHPLGERVEPGDTANWSITIENVTGGPMKTVEYQVTIYEEPFGGVIKGYVIILPEQVKDMERQLQDKIDDLVARGEQEIEQHIDQIIQEINQELERQAEKAVDDLISQCQTSVGILTIGVAYLYTQRKKSD